MGIFQWGGEPQLRWHIDLHNTLPTLKGLKKNMPYAYPPPFTSTPQAWYTRSMTDPTPMQPNKRDAKQVETLSGLGASEQYICTHLNITPEQLHEYYQVQLDYGQEHANLEVAETFYDLATSGDHPNITAMWMKMRAGWTESSPTLSTQEEDTSQIETAKDKLLKLLNRAHA